ncbi:DNA polymerase III subunit alpha [Patescibacteria group bacterium]|nr:DNA polymerase III subunit alpha [Patescibacteria group bacterium]
MKFTHLHVHSHYSLLDGLPKIKELVSYAKELGMDSLALTDHGVLYGAVEFFKACQEKGIKPIIGCEVYQAYEKMDQRRVNIDHKRYHLVLLAKNKQGYINLVKLITKAHLEGFYYKPRVDEELLAQHSEGLIALSACLQGKIPQLILANRIEDAKKQALKYQEIFGKGNFYLEIQHHDHIPEQEKINNALIGFSKELNIPLVATNDSHYLKSDDAEVQDILMLINTGADPNDPERLTMKADDFSLRPPHEMEKLFLRTPEAIENTQKIAEACNFQFELGKTKLPIFQVPDNKNPEAYLEELCYQGLKTRFGEKPDNNVIERLKYELSVIQKTGFAGYFLIVQDFVNWAKSNRIVVGPGRGSVGGSLVSYLLNITNVDPLKNDLLFERFLNPERISMPDIDLDFTDRRRDEVINYVAEKYGKDHVAQIITFGTMAARAAVRDVGRALIIPYSYCDRIAKMIPFGMSLEETLEGVNEFKELYESDSDAKRLIDLAKRLEGVARHASTHACGIVISAAPLTDYVPLQHPTQNDESIVTQYEMHAIEDLGLLKMDLLGLKNLTIIEDCLTRIYSIYNKSIAIDNIPLDDEKTYKLLREANSVGVFQLESSGMRAYLKQLKPTSFEDIVAMVALYRPGPMQFIPDFIKGKHGKKKIEYLHPKLEPILKTTYGVCVYQEQLMQIAQHLAGFSLAEADVLRKAVGKKIKELLHAQKEKFIAGCIKNNVPEKTAKEIWQWFLPFAEYAFNKCVTGDTEIINSETGQIMKVENVYKNPQLVRETFCISDNLKIEKGAIVSVFSNGKKPVFEVKTRSGRKITATANHPFLSQYNWRVLEDIKIGERIAVPRTIPAPKKTVTIDGYKIALLGYLLAEGNFCHPNTFYFYSNLEEEVSDYLQYLEKFNNTLGRKDYRKSAIAVNTKRIDVKEPSAAVEWIKELGLKNKKATEKFIPPFVFQLPNSQLALLVGKMFQGDGCINLKRKYPQIFYATSSEDIAKSLQTIFLRLEIISTVHEKKFKYRGGIKIGYTININRYDNIQKFAKLIGPHLLKNKQSVLNKIIKTHPILNGSIKTWSARESKDIIPVNLILPLIRGVVLEKELVFSGVARENEFSEKLFLSDPRKSGFLRETVEIFYKALGDENIKKYADSEVYWDEIVSIEKKGEKETFDLTIKGNHNFIANNIFVHNSHSVAYATIACQTAYLKAHYPVEFMAALLTSEKADVERIAVLIKECKKMGVPVLPPDLNESFRNFSVVPDENKIRFGLLAIKNVGENIVEAIITERKNAGPFKSMYDFVSRIQTKTLNKKSMESLIKAGVFDKLEERNKLLHNLGDILEANREIKQNLNNGQKNLFADCASFNHNDLRLKPAQVISLTDQLNWEKELLGLYVSSHPLESYKKIFEGKSFPLNKLTEEMVGKLVKIGGIVSTVKRIITRTGKPMLFLDLEDLTDKIEVVVFPTIIEKNPAVFEENKIVFVRGRVDNRDGEIKVIADNVEEIVEV